VHERAASIWDDLGLPRFSADEIRAKVEMWANNPIAAERYLRRYYQSVEAMGDLGHLSTTAAYLAHALYAQGRYEEAEEFARIAEEKGASDDVAPDSPAFAALWPMRRGCG
jgi:hypothetical protein